MDRNCNCIAPRNKLQMEHVFNSFGQLLRQKDRLAYAMLFLYGAWQELKA